MLIVRLLWASLSWPTPPILGTDKSTFRSISVNRVLTMKKMIRLKTMSIIGVRLIDGRSSWWVLSGIVSRSKFQVSRWNDSWFLATCNVELETFSCCLPPRPPVRVAGDQLDDLLAEGVNFGNQR